MKIAFKSEQFNFATNEKQGNIQFSSRVEVENEGGYRCLTFHENREGKKITNRIEYNDKELKIFSGASSLTCDYDSVVKNGWAVNGIESTSIYIYTKMSKVDISDNNHLIFEYVVSATDKCEDGTLIKLDITLSND